MAIIRWDPFQALSQVFEEDLPLTRFPAVADLAADVYEDGNNVVVEMHLPAVDTDKLDISVEDNHLRISGTKEETIEKEKKNYFYKEIKRGSFERTIRLPMDVKGSQAKASYEDGILKVTIPKKNEETKKIKVEVKKK